MLRPLTARPAITAPAPGICGDPGVAPPLAEDLQILRSAAGSWIDNDDGIAAVERLRANDAARWTELYPNETAASK